MSEHDGHAAGPASPDQAQQPPTEPPESQAASTRTIGRGRLIFVDALITIATVLGVVAIFSVWANRLLFSPDNWENTSTQLLQNSEIRNATANYVVDQLYANVDVAGVIKAGLPPRAQPLAGPAAGALRTAAVQAVDVALTRPRVQNLWAKANRAADQAFIAIVEGGGPRVGVNQGVVTLNLAAIVNNVAARLGLPANIGAKLPPTVANMTVIRSQQLKFVQNVGNGIKGLALWLTILVPVLYGTAVILAVNHRRRTLMTAGFAIVLAGVIALLGRSILETQIVNSIVQDASVRPAASAVMAIGTSMITEIAGAFLFVGIITIAASWFAGPARAAVAGRRAITPYMRDRPGWAFGLVVAVMALIFIWNPIPATGKPAGMIVFMLLALLGTEVLRRQTLTEFPEARTGEAGAAIWARLQAVREHRRRDGGAVATEASLPEHLERLAVLRDKGAITQDEYDSAKARLLTR